MWKRMQGAGQGEVDYFVLFYLQGDADSWELLAKSFSIK